MTTGELIQVILMGLLVVVTGIYAWRTFAISNAAKEQSDASVEMAKEMREQRIMASRPVIIQKAIERGKYSTERDMPDDFEICNVGNGPAIELEISLLNKERYQITSERKTYLRAGEPPIQFAPFQSVDLEEALYYVVCEYQGILSRSQKAQTWYQTWLPFELLKSKNAKIYVKPGELIFKEVTEKDRIDAFGSRSKPK